MANNTFVRGCQYNSSMPRLDRKPKPINPSRPAWVDELVREHRLRMRRLGVRG